MNHTAFFGDAVRTFALTDAILEELEFKTGVGIGAFYQRVINRQFRAADIVEVIRCGLIGGGTSPEQAERLVDAFAKNRPYNETVPLAIEVLDARWLGPVDRAVFINEADLQQAARTGDMSAAIDETLAEAGIE